MKKIILAAVVASAMAAPAMANNFSYQNIEAQVGKTGDFKNLGVGLKLALNDTVYFTGSTASGDHKDLDDVDGRVFNMGLGAHHDITHVVQFAPTDFFYEATYDNERVKAAGVTFKDKGYTLRAGFRTNFEVPNLDVEAFYGHKENTHLPDTGIYGVGFQYALNESFSFGADLSKEHKSKDETVLAKVKYHF